MEMENSGWSIWGTPKSPGHRLGYSGISRVQLVAMESTEKNHCFSPTHDSHWSTRASQIYRFPVSHLARVTFFYIHLGENINPHPQKCCHSCTWCHSLENFFSYWIIMCWIWVTFFGKPLIDLDIGQCSFKKTPNLKYSNLQLKNNHW